MIGEQCFCPSTVLACSHGVRRQFFLIRREDFDSLRGLIDLASRIRWADGLNESNVEGVIADGRAYVRREAA